MKIFMQTTYYAPHTSGLTLLLKRLAEDLVKAGHEVTVMAAQHEKKLARQEEINGVKLIRTPYLFKLNKGLFLHRIAFDAFAQIKQADVIHLNLPAVEGIIIAIIAKLLKKPVVSTYVCDITLPKFPGSKVLEKVVDLIHLLILRLTDVKVSLTLDFVRGSRLLANQADEFREIYPHIGLPKDAEKVANLASVVKMEKRPLIGMASRLAAEKGVHITIKALDLLMKKYPDAILVIAGDIRAVGEEKYHEKLMKLVETHNNIKLLGRLSEAQMKTFFREIDLLVVASTNSTEAFGMVQAEAMLEGTPVVATELPGVKVPIEVTEMGEVVKIGSAKALAEGIDNVLSDPKKYQQSQQKIKKIFSSNRTVNEYLKAYQQAITKISK